MQHKSSSVVAAMCPIPPIGIKEIRPIWLTTLDVEYEITARSEQPGAAQAIKGKWMRGQAEARAEEAMTSGGTRSFQAQAQELERWRARKAAGKGRKTK